MAWHRARRRGHQQQTAVRNASHGAHRLAAVELVPAALTSAHPLFGPASAELWRRWHAARDHHPDGETVEQARQILAVLTLIQELWTFQQAGIEPAALYADRASPGRLQAVLDRDSERGDPAQAQAASWVVPAVFGADQTVLDEQTRLVGHLTDDQLRTQLVLGARTLSTLHGPWSLPMVLAHQVGKPYVWPHSHAPQGFRRCGADVATAAAFLDIVIAEEIRRVAGDFPTGQLATEVSKLPAGRVVTMHHDAEAFSRFLTAALAAHYATGEPWDVCVDARPVPPALVRWVLDLHHDAASVGGYPASAITVGGLRVRFAPDIDQQRTVAQIDAVGTVKHVEPDRLLGLLQTLTGYRRGDDRGEAAPHRRTPRPTSRRTGNAPARLNAADATGPLRAVAVRHPVDAARHEEPVANRAAVGYSGHCRGVSRGGRNHGHARSVVHRGSGVYWCSGIEPRIIALAAISVTRPCRLNAQRRELPGASN